MGMLFFYSEVEFKYKNILYGLNLTHKQVIEYGSSPNDVQYFKTSEEFVNNAKTFDDKLLKDIWNEVENAKYM